MNIAVFASGEGTDMQAIIDGCKKGMIDGEVCVIISNNEGTNALNRAKKELKISSIQIQGKWYWVLELKEEDNQILTKNDENVTN